MKYLTKVVIFMIGACSLLSSTTALCETPNCYNCDLCNRDCTQLKQNCDTDCIVQVRQFLCQMENANCKKTQGCDVPPVAVSIYPAANYDESRKEWIAQVFQARKNCCYNLSGVYDNTLSGIKNNGACVQLFDGANCTGASIKFDGTSTVDCLKWIDCPARIAASGVYFNDKTSSFKLC